ncbi:MAG: UDP-N-acetylmuramoyl-L-alanine--D-glutamate ligase [Actinomycetaceae bacterium]|nr:UDP-N-acetylmuramoyl-L-alanine--D-glutamate ligase [Actinomycetaceae bacterium]
MNVLDTVTVVVAGLGVSGSATAEVARACGARIIALDTRSDVVDRVRREDPRLDARLVDHASQAREIYADADVIVISPGIAPHEPLYVEATLAAAPLVSEIEFAWQLEGKLGRRRDWLCVTGTNGKTTTVGMCASILDAAGIKSRACGNVGTPVVRAITEADTSALVVELSSFQLHTTSSVSPLASVCLNVASDHLDWHGDEASYRADKARVYEHTRRACLYPVGDATVTRMVEDADVVEGARAVGLTLGIPGPSQLGCVEDLLLDRAFIADRRRSAQQIATFGDLAHLGGAIPAAPIVADALAAAGLARAGGVSAEAVSEGLRSFVPAAHRRSVVSQATGVTWIDDSKATNSHAARASLTGMEPRSVVWIAGGDAKGQVFDDLVASVKDTLRGVVLIGRDRAPLREALRRGAPDVAVVELEDHPEIMTSAVNEAVALSIPGNSVILAPACASWDQFANYSARGEAFREAIEGLERA